MSADPGRNYPARVYTGPASPGMPQAKPMPQPPGMPQAFNPMPQPPGMPPGYNQMQAPPRMPMPAPSGMPQVQMPAPPTGFNPAHVPQPSGASPWVGANQYSAGAGQQGGPQYNQGGLGGMQGNAQPAAQYGGYAANPSQGYANNYAQQGYPQMPAQPAVPAPMVSTVQPGMPHMPQNPGYVPAPMITTVKPGMPPPFPGASPMPIPPAYHPVSYVPAQPAQPAAAQKPVPMVLCNACNQNVREVDMYLKKCEDPNHRVCGECVNKAYMAEESPSCPFCKREYSQLELAEIHQLLLYNDTYRGQLGANPKKPGAGAMEICAFGHETNKQNFIPNACANGCKVCRQHYTSQTICSCGQTLGGDMSQYAQEG